MSTSYNGVRYYQLNAERASYNDYMATLPFPSGLPCVETLKPIFALSNPQFTFRTHLIANPPRSHFYAPNRTVWCPGSNGDFNDAKTHLLIYCPTHLYDPLWSDWWVRDAEASPTGQTRDLFVLSEDSQFVLYVGAYTLLSLRHVHPPGSPAPSEVSRRQLGLYAGVGENAKHSRLEPYFPGAVLPTECFGLQRVGFDEEYYQLLLEKYSESQHNPPHKKRGRRGPGASGRPD
ncbi:hypothetical protein R3P38DRAFT_3169371 [Favolaschia claudopus]|uniref:Uncharacterized protein n=1 Tax=Favolaschia claudopus TaxID=2862362 RepID=A0AAW0DYZ5_9AGAR